MGFAAVHPSRIFCCAAHQDFRTHGRKTPYSAPDPAPLSPALIEKVVRSSWLLIGRKGSSPGVSTQYPIRGRQRETPADYCLLGVQHRHSWASARDASGTTEGSQDTVEKTATANRSSGAAGHEGKATSRLQSDALLESLYPGLRNAGRNNRCQTIKHP